MQLSVIIVNYNVKYFLEQCLYSVLKATIGIDAEVFVVDNASADDSVAYLQKTFPRVKFIASTTNDGFAKANNKALFQSTGEYILFLNPDTIVPEDCFKNCINFFKQHKQCGALGVQMIDGSGKFLPESKRSFPSFLTAFYKLIGLSLVFPKSKVFNKYALGNLPRNHTHEIDVLAGAFMMIKKEIALQTKGFDETFFMYGEDIDLSYRIQQLGFKNYYFGEQPIIHFKGESTKRGSLNYVRMFFKAMSVFVSKHYGSGKATVFSIAINIAIWLRAIVTLLQNILIKMGLPFFDALVVFFCLFATNKFWINVLRDGLPFSNFSTQYALPGFTLAFMIGAFLSGMYDNLYKPAKAFLSSISAIIVMLAVYSLLPENLRFSRGVMLGGGLFCGIMVTFFRWLFIKTQLLKNNDESSKAGQTLVVGTLGDYSHIMQMMTAAGMADRVLGRISLKDNEENAIGSLQQINILVKQLNIGEVIFCEGQLSFAEMIGKIEQLSSAKISFRFHARKSQSIVGSDSKATTGEALTADGHYELSNPYQLRMKRMVDVWVAFIMLVSFPFQFLFINNVTKALSNAWKVISGQKTWVGFSVHQNKLPKIAQGVITPQGYIIDSEYPVIQSVLKKTDSFYAKDYDWLNDLKIIYSNYRNLGG